jgi:hypothetical protein
MSSALCLFMSCTLEQSNEFARKLYLWRATTTGCPGFTGMTTFPSLRAKRSNRYGGTMDCFVASLLAMRARRAHRRRPPRRHRPRRRTIEYAAASRFDQRHLRLLDARLRGHDGELLRGRPALSAYLAPPAGRGRILREAKNPGEGTLSEFRCGDSPSPQPSKSELRSSRPREERGEGAHCAYCAASRASPSAG